MTLEKPPHGSPCNSCGKCCRAMICPLGQRVFGRKDGPCPAIEKQDDGRELCGLMVKPGNYAKMRLIAKHGADALSAAARLMNGAGTGCDAVDFGEERNADYDKQTAREAAGVSDAAVGRALKTWGLIR